jgi:hypothetical protein
MKIKIERVTGDPRIFGSKICRLGLARNKFSNSTRYAENHLFRSIILADGKCDARSSDKKTLKIES